MITASISLSLIALASGMFLCAKAVKDNLGLLYRIVAYFIIIASLLSLGCSAMHMAFRMGSKAHFMKEMKMHKHKMEDGFHEGMMGGGCPCTMMGECRGCGDVNCGCEKGQCGHYGERCEMDSISKKRMPGPNK